MEIVIFYTEILTEKVVFVLCGVFLEWKNPQFNFSSQNISIECKFFKWDGKESISHLLFHRIWKKFIFASTQSDPPQYKKIKKTLTS